MNIVYSHLRSGALGAALLAAALAGCVAAPPQLPEVVAPPPHSVAEADARLARAAADRARAEATFAADERQCTTRFLVNNCLDKAREKRREGLSGLRGIEVEARRYLRQAKVDERDRELAKAEAQFQADAARIAATPAPVRAADPAAAAPRPAPARQKAAKVDKPDAGDPAGAAKRAANVQAFEKRKRASEQRQKEIEEKKRKAVSEGEAK